MTVSVQIKNLWCNVGESFERWFKAYNITITSGHADVIVIDYETWRSASKDILSDSLIVIVSSYTPPFLMLPPYTMFLLIPIEYDITIERIIKIHKLKQLKNDEN